MTLDAATTAIASVAPTYAAPESAPPRARTFLRQAMLDTWASRAARFGLAWILLLVLGAVFAPFIASSFPIAVKIAGRWSSPLLANLTPSDVTLLAAFATAAVLVITQRLS